MFQVGRTGPNFSRMPGRLREFGWAGGWLWRGGDGRLRLYVIGFTTGQVGTLPHWGFLGNQSQIGLPLFAETLQFVQGTVEGALQSVFLAVDHDQRRFPGGTGGSPVTAGCSRRLLPAMLLCGAGGSPAPCSRSAQAEGGEL